MTVKLHLTRDSVAAGDDIHAPHGEVEWFPGPITTPGDLFAIIEAVAPAYLPSVAGRAGWTVYSAIPLGVLSDRHAPLRPLDLREPDLQRLDRRDGALHIHFAYLAMDDPELAYCRSAAALGR